jgi:hypothetical protein
MPSSAREPPRPHAARRRAAIAAAAVTRSSTMRKAGRWMKLLAAPASEMFTT